MKKISIIIPAYNEVKNLQNNPLDEVDEYLKKQKYPYEVLIVDDGSKDKTAEIIEQQIKNKSNFRLIKNFHGGKAMTVMFGLLHSNADIALFTDMDQATPIGEIEKLLPKFDEGFDIVIGSRSGRKGAPVLRKVMAGGFALLRGVVLGLPFKDTQCGFKAFSSKSVEEIFPLMEKNWKRMKVHGAAVNAGFDVETLFIARKKGFKIAEVEVAWHHVGTERVQAIKDSLDGLKDVLRIRFNSVTGKYG